jgi:hypothetical protein
VEPGNSVGRFNSSRRYDRTSREEAEKSWGLTAARRLHEGG